MKMSICALLLFSLFALQYDYATSSGDATLGDSTGNMMKLYCEVAFDNQVQQLRRNNPKAVVYGQRRASIIATKKYVNFSKSTY